jgi:cytoskeletal protein RodZ
MSTPDPHDGSSSSQPGKAEMAAGPPDRRETAEPSGGQAPHKRRSRWVWISVVLAVVAAGLLIWALTIQSDLNSTQQEVTDLQAQVDQNEETGSELVTAGKAVIDDLAQQLGATSEDLEAAEEGIADAEQAATQAQADAAAAERDAAAADNETDKARAEAEQAKAEAQAAESKAGIAADCAKAYVSAFGALFEGESVSAQAPAVREELEKISADGKAAFAGT